MINFSLKEFVDENIQNFDPQNPQDIIKAEKLLKAESKLNNTFTINEIEEFLEYIKTQEQNFDHILNLPVIKSIYQDIYPENLKNKPDLRSISESEIEEFREVFTPFLKEFISVSVRNNQWQNLIDFQYFYAHFFSMESLDFYKVLLHDKNNLVIEGIMKNINLPFFKKNYPFAVDQKFYFLQSMVDNFEFDEDILTIYSAVEENQKTSITNKGVLGEILTAILHFNSSNSDTNNLIRKSQTIAEEWKIQKNDLMSKIAYCIANFFAKSQNPGLHLFISVIIFGVYLLSFFFLLPIKRGTLIYYSIAFFIAIHLAYRNYKYYFSLFDHKRQAGTLGKISTALSVTLIASLPLMGIVGLILAYLHSPFGRKYSAVIIVPLIFVITRVFFNKNK